MNQSIYSKQPDRKPLVPTDQSSGFTLIELLVVIGILALLGAMLLPALAANKRNPKLVQCLSNMHQIAMGSSVYAADFNGWHPIVSIGSAFTGSYRYNFINGIHYTRYVYTDYGSASGDVMPRDYALGRNASLSYGIDQNLGYLYGGRMIPDGHALFCPAFADAKPTSLLYALSADFYSSPQFMSTHLNAAIRSSYMFNPRMQTPIAGAQRAYQKVTDVKQLDVLGMDYLASGGGANPDGSAIPAGAPFTPDVWAHWPYKGLSTAFTDGSARFCTFAPANFNSIVTTLNSDQTGGVWAAQYNAIFNWLRDAP